MKGLGTLINTLAVIVGGLIGLRLKSGIPDKMQHSLMQACGISTIFIGISGTLAKMLVVSDNGISTSGTMLLILSLVLGALLGEWIDLEAKMESLGEWIKHTIHADNDNQFVDAFVNVSLIICIGAMAIVGSIQDGVSGDYSMLTAKAILDLIIVMVFASSQGLGALFSFVPIFVYQGSITLMAMLLGAFMSQPLIDVLCLVGNALIFCVGINITFGKRIRVGNLLPALIFAVVLHILADTFAISFLLG